MARTVFAPTSLIHVGTHKTGSTWLQKHLLSQARFGFRSYADAAMDDKTRVKFIGRLIIEYARQAGPERERIATTMCAKLQTRFPGAGIVAISHEGLAGDPLFDLRGYERTAAAIKELFARPLVLLVVREQRNLLLSNYLHYCRAGGRRSLAQVYSLGGTHTPEEILGFWRYDRIARHYMDVLGRDRVCVLPYELLRHDRIAFVTAILRFCAIADLPDQLSRSRENANEDYFATLLMRRFGFVGAIDQSGKFYSKSSLKRRILLPVHRACRRQIAALAPAFLQDRARTRLRDELGRLVPSGFYARSNRTLAQLTGLDLAGYGYEGLAGENAGAGDHAGEAAPPAPALRQDPTAD